MRGLRFKLLVPMLLYSIWVAQAQYHYETIIDEPVGPGMTHRRIIEKSQPWQIHVLEIDLRNPYVKFESVKARDLLAGRETTSSMARRNQYKGHRVVAAINGDFFEADGTPVNLQIREGEILRKPIARTVVGFSGNARPVWGRLQFSGSVAKESSVATIGDINGTRDSNELVLYNRWFGSSTLTNAFGSEAVLHPLHGWQVNDTLTCVIDSAAAGIGNMVIPQSGAVLSGHGSAAAFIKTNLHKGDTVKLWLGLPPCKDKIREMVGGLPQIVVNGKEDVAAAQRKEGGNDAFTHSRHPRTAVGLNADSSRFYFVTVDGRQPVISNGMSLKELADFLIHIGVYHGVNLDGGGSTTMVVDDVMVNSPSDATGERTVANAMLLISTAPKGDISRLAVQPKALRVLAGQEIVLPAKGLDQYWNVITEDPAQFRYSCNPLLGSATAAGLFRAGSIDLDGFVTISFGAVVDSVRIQVRTISEFAVSPKRPVTDTTRSLSFMVSVRDSDGLAHYPKVLWTCLDPEIGFVDSLGLFHADQAGTARIVAAALGRQDTALVTVMIGRGTQPLDPIEDLNGWSLQLIHMDSAATRLVVDSLQVSTGQYGLRLDYSFTYRNGYANWIYVKKPLLIPGQPDSIMIDLGLDGMQHIALFYASDENGDLFRFVPRKQPTDVNAFNRVGVATTAAQAVVTGTTLEYPLRFEYLAIKLASTFEAGKAFQGALYIDNLRISYPQKITTVPFVQQTSPRTFQFWPNYPNPFNDHTIIPFRNSIGRHFKFSLFDVLGRCCGVVYDQWTEPGHHRIYLQSKGLASGVYYLSDESGRLSTQRMVLLK